MDFDVNFAKVYRPIFTCFGGAVSKVWVKILIRRLRSRLVRYAGPGLTECGR